MRCVICGSHQAELWRLRLENISEAWSVTIVPEPARAAALLRTEPFDVLILGGASGVHQLAELLQVRTCMTPPYLVLEQREQLLCDAVSDVLHAEQAARQLMMYREACRLPVLCLLQLERMTCLARSLLHALGVRPGLRAMVFLPDMLALCALHPSLLQELSVHLYPLMAKRHGITPAAVERSLRLLVESTWSRVPLSALERFFGHSVDPERGKPTNREFLAQLQQRLLLAARRWQG